MVDHPECAMTSMTSMTQSLRMKMMMELILNQFACPEQMPSSGDEQPKHARGRPCKPKSSDTGDEPKRG